MLVKKLLFLFIFALFSFLAHAQNYHPSFGQVIYRVYQIDCLSIVDCNEVEDQTIGGILVKDESGIAFHSNGNLNRI